LFVCLLLCCICAVACNVVVCFCLAPFIFVALSVFVSCCELFSGLLMCFCVI
jgi:hypothetical protein